MDQSVVLPFIFSFSALCMFQLISFEQKVHKLYSLSLSLSLALTKSVYKGPFRHAKPQSYCGNNNHGHVGVILPRYITLSFSPSLLANKLTAEFLTEVTASERVKLIKAPKMHPHNFVLAFPFTRHLLSLSLFLAWCIFIELAKVYFADAIAVRLINPFTNQYTNTSIWPFLLDLFLPSYCRLSLSLHPSHTACTDEISFTSEFAHCSNACKSSH